MDSFEQFLADEGYENFHKAKYLSNEESKNDPENEPFQSKYKARELWQELKLAIEKYENEDTGDSRWRRLQGVLEFYLGVNYVETEETASGEERLNKCLESLEQFSLEKHSCCTVQMALNQLGIVWSSRRNSSKALTYLQRAETLYKQYRHEVGGAPDMPEEHFETKKPDEENLTRKREEHFEDNYTHTLYYLAQVYGHLEESKTSAEYCQVTLRRQLETKKYDPVDWALNAATLSQYYITAENFPMAHQCLASASYIVKEAGEPEPVVEPVEGEDQEQLTARERLPRTQADIRRCWAKYGLALLETSKDKLLQELDHNHSDTQDATPDHNNDHNADVNEKKDENKDEKEENSEYEKEENSECAEGASAAESEIQEEKSVLRFDLELTAFEEEITSKYLLDYDQARQVFLSVQNWLNGAREFYSLDDHCSDHVEIIQDLSRAFKLLAFFDMSFDRQSKMHKRRADMLNALLKSLNPQFYLLICRQLMYEVAETYGAMLDLKLTIIEESGQPTPHAVHKINQLTLQSIQTYQAYLDSLRDANKELPKQFSSDDERPALVAHFCMGRLYSKFIESEVPRRLAMMNKSLEHYKYIVDYCERNPSATQVVRSERDICEEMVALMPVKMEKIMAEAQ